MKGLAKPVRNILLGKESGKNIFSITRRHEMSGEAGAEYLAWEGGWQEYFPDNP